MAQRIDPKDLMTKFHDAVGSRLHYLYCRWLDEREYEDFSEYESAIKSAVESVEGMPKAKYVKTKKRPFGPVFWFCGRKCQITVTTTSTKMFTVS